MKKKSLLTVLTILFFVVSCSTIPTKEKAIILEYQGISVKKQFGIGEVYDTTRTYKAMYLKDSVCFIYTTVNSRFNVGDKFMASIDR